MTYCVAITLKAGMVFASDSRTNAGVDHVASYRKMRVFSREGDRVIVILSSGNLSITQSAINLLPIYPVPPVMKIFFIIFNIFRQIKDNPVTRKV